MVRSIVSGATHPSVMALFANGHALLFSACPCVSSYSVWLLSVRKCSCSVLALLQQNCLVTFQVFGQFLSLSNISNISGVVSRMYLGAFCMSEGYLFKSLSIITKKFESPSVNITTMQLATVSI